MNKRKCKTCGSQMEWRPIAGRWVCYECMQAPGLNLYPHDVQIDDMVTLWIAEAFMRVNARDTDS
jgi:ribosomal protein L37AE/L43A